MEKQLKYVGQTYPIHNAREKVRGEEMYTGDLKWPRMLHAKLLLSPVGHGRIKKIDGEQAKNFPGVIGVFSCQNGPKQKFNRYVTYPGQEEYCPLDQNIFSDTARFVGDVVAAVVAVDYDTAQKAADLIHVEYEELPVMITVEEALEKGGYKIHPEGNVLAEYTTEAGSEDTLPDGGWVIESSARTQKVHHAAMENHVCVASFDTRGQMTIWTPCQGAFGVRTVVADLLGLKYSMVRVIKMTMGGSFGGKQEAILEPLTAYLAKETGSPVKVQFERWESMLATMTRPATQTKIRTQVTPEGNFLACRLWSTLDAGAYATSSTDYALALTNKICRLYRIPYYRHEAKAVYTNTPVAGGMRGWGSPEIFTAMEIHLDQVAQTIGLDPVDLRLKNLVHPYDLDPVFKLSLGNARVVECLQKGVEEFAWKDRYQKARETGRFRRGVGMACAAHVNGMYGDGDFPEFSMMTLTLNEDGTFILNTAVHDLGCGAVMSMKQIVAEALDIPLDFVTVLEADTASSPYDLGCFASRTTYVCGACALKAAEKMRELILETGAGILARPKQDLTIDHGCVLSQGDGRSLPYRQIAAHALMKNSTNITVHELFQAVSNPGAYGVHFAEVEVDTETGRTKVIDYLAVQDIGKAINPGAVEGQVQGAVQMGIGYALCEEIKFNDAGKPVNYSFKNYHLINAADMPAVKVMLVEQGGDHGPFGAKSVGECAAGPVAAAVVNAVNHALGTELSELPLTPIKILTALKQKSLVRK
ncbi:xanthine dehydrogenase family protein molybdopterin-binding subunit [Candidatus Formimonas warabiya]|uniref:Aldehyde oxidase n=1 Tax=Formimonas warabiya TaxID=1761012 RepID=A0A3G1KZ39_FORW1|nr:molybdopterin cofactor-binding domain-containing protein [Candidatus Formimonas warabiya]ATW27748.1 aldehyde oxidase [Candidatus Formimonas warabiya]